MRMRRPSTRGILKRALSTMVSAQFLIVVALMVTTKVRKMMRGHGGGTFPVTPPTPLGIGSGNTATAYTYGSDLFEDMLEAIGSARERILFETYIIKGDEMGRRFKRALIDGGRPRGRRLRHLRRLRQPRRDAELPQVSRPRSMCCAIRCSPPAGGSSARGRWAATTASSWLSIMISRSSAALISASCMRLSGATRICRHPRTGRALRPIPPLRRLLAQQSRTAPPMLSDRPIPTGPENQVYYNDPGRRLFPIRGMYLEVINRARSIST